jgi:hypothetical protein
MRRLSSPVLAMQFENVSEFRRRRAAAIARSARDPSFWHGYALHPYQKEA